MDYCSVVLSFFEFWLYHRISGLFLRMTMNETDIIGHLIQIESEAANMIMDAQTEADRRITEAKKKADDLYKEKYDNLINSLEANLQESKSKIDLEYDNLFNEFKENITTVSQDKRMLNQKLDSYLFGSENG